MTVLSVQASAPRLLIVEPDRLVDARDDEHAFKQLFHPLDPLPDGGGVGLERGEFPPHLRCGFDNLGHGVSALMRVSASPTNV